MRRRRTFRAFLVLALLGGSVGLMAPHAGALLQGDPDRTLRVEDVGPGVCRPVVVEPFDSSTCRFPLIGGGGVLDPLRGPYTAEYRTPSGLVASLPCRVESDALVCRSMRATFDQGTFDVVARFGGRTTGVVASVGQEPGSAGLVTMRVFPPVAVAGSPRPIVFEERFGFDRAAGVYVQLRDEATDEVLETVEAKAPGADFALVDDLETGAEAIGFEFVTDRTGPVVLGLCAGPSEGDCTESPIRKAIDVVTAEPAEVIAGHNIAGADRIDVVIATVGDVEGMRPGVVRELLGLDGPAVLDVVGRPTQSAPASIVYGPFAMEPLRSALDRFNLWMLPDPLTDPVALSSPFPDLYRSATGFNAVQATVLVSARRGEELPDQAEPTTFDGEMRLPDPGSDRFGAVVVSVPELGPLSVATVLSHEWGHGLFGLLDEYVDLSGRFTLRFGYPNCASSEDEAASWWRSLEGSIDPFYEEWAADLRAAGLDVPTPPDDVTVGFVRGGCYSPGLDAVRPTVDSLMNQIIPVLGSVNRARVEAILASFSGQLELVIDASLAGRVSLACSPTSQEAGATVECAGELPPHVVSPTGRLFLLVASEAQCIIAAGPDDAARPFVCGPLDVGTVAGERPVLASFTGGTGPSPYGETGISVGVVAAPPPPAGSTTTAPTVTTTTTTTAGAPERSISDDSGVGRWPVVGGLALVIAGLAAWRVARRRRR